MNVRGNMTLKELRIQNGKTAKEVAEELGVRSTAISNYEQGIRRISLEQVLKLSKLYECSAEEIIRAQINSCQKVR